MAEERSVFPSDNVTSSSSRDPVQVLIDIVTNGNIPDADKTRLITFAQNRFRHRRRMAYVCLYTIVVSVGFVFLAAVIDAYGDKAILNTLNTMTTFLGVIEFFLTGIVAAYYGMSSWRPSS